MSEHDKPPPHRRIVPDEYGIKGQLSQVIEAANRDPDAVSLMRLREDGKSFAGAVVVIKGDGAVREFEAWAEGRHLSPGDPEKPTDLSTALGLPNPAGRGPAYWMSPPMPCPCSDSECTASCVEVGCRRHPAAGLRALVFDGRVTMLCSVCSRAVFSSDRSAVSPCAKRAGNSNDFN